MSSESAYVPVQKPYANTPQSPALTRTSPQAQNPPVLTLVPTTTIVPADWRTYRNEKYGFEFKYPPDFKIYEFPPAGDERENILLKEVSVSNYEIYYTRGEPGYISNFRLSIRPGYPLTLDFKYPTAPQPETTKMTIITLGNNSYQTLNGTFLTGTYYLKKQGSEKNWVVFDLYSNTQLPEIKNHAGFLNRQAQIKIEQDILSTFQFIK